MVKERNEERTGNREDQKKSNTPQPHFPSNLSSLRKVLKAIKGMEDLEKSIPSLDFVFPSIQRQNRPFSLPPPPLFFLVISCFLGEGMQT